SMPSELPSPPPPRRPASNAAVEPAGERCGAVEACEARLRGEPVVRAVLEATLDELASVGFAALNIERIAERAGVNKTTVYRRWPTKSDLVAAAMFAHKKDLELPDTGNLRDDLIALLLNGARFMSEPRGKSLFRVLMGERHNNELSQLSERMRRDGEHSPRILLQRAIARGELPPDIDLHLLMQTLFGPIIHRVFLDNDVFERDEAERLVDIVLHGVCARRSCTAAAAPAPRRSRTRT
ncbi:MAG: TetR/AcrR family transcriptional regulator, partial [Myxococcales bacterium]